MERQIPPDLNWLAPWQAVDDPSRLNAELARELIEGHPLFGLPARAIAQRFDRSCSVRHRPRRS